MVDTKRLNSLFLVAKNNDDALKELTNLLLILGKRMAQNIIRKFGIFSFRFEDIEDYILFIINYIYNNYDSSKHSFGEYASFVMYKRLTTRIIDSTNSNYSKIESLDDINDDGLIIYETIANPNEVPIPDLVSEREYHLKMSSPRASDSSIERKKKLVFNLIAKGYTGNEIMKILRITLGQFTYLKKQIKNDNTNNEFKIELK